MRSTNKFVLLLLLGVALTSCVSKKKFISQTSELEAANREIVKFTTQYGECMQQLTACDQEKNSVKADLNACLSASRLREEQINDLKSQVDDLRKQRDQQVAQAGSLTQLSQDANKNMQQTLDQLAKKDQYIYLLQNAKTRADSINLALAVNLKSILPQGLADDDVEVKVDKTVVLINLSDKMLFQSGSYKLTPRAKEVLGKIATILESRPELEVMVEGYTDNVPIKNSCIDDNWDLSVKRSTSVVRVLQNDYKINPNRIIAAGRGEYNTLASNDTAEGRSTNRRTRIIIMPKIDQFYELLNPNNVPK
ncbi:MAG: OmpA family protein [Saprospiraceae bacterium]|nr:OmpA family protein [Saprospiraceae bacterium]